MGNIVEEIIIVADHHKKIMSSKCRRLESCKKTFQFHLRGVAEVLSMRTDGWRPKAWILTVRHEHKELLGSKVSETLRRKISNPEVFRENDMVDWVACDIEKDTDLCSFERENQQIIMPVGPPAFLRYFTSVRFTIPANSPTPRIRI